jgi:hypothetical protein
MTRVLIFLLAQLADILTTHYGMRAGLREINPLGCSIETIVIKVLATVLVASVMFVNRSRLGWLMWLPGGIMYLVVIWNIVNILTSA